MILLVSVEVIVETFVLLRLLFFIAILRLSNALDSKVVVGLAQCVGDSWKVKTVQFLFKIVVAIFILLLSF